jgi:pyruvate kinase
MVATGSVTQPPFAKDATTLSPIARRTKIVATLGPATDSDEMLDSLVKMGVDIFRFNMSHAKAAWVKSTAARLRAIAAQHQRLVALLIDTQGPAIRTGDLRQPLTLKAGDTFTFTVRGHRSTEEYSVDVNYDDLVNDINAGDIVLVDNGLLRMQVVSKEANRIDCKVLTPGQLGNRRHINLPGVKVNLPAITEKDKEDILTGIEAGMDFVALSFVREAADIQTLRDYLAAHGGKHMRVVAKIEDQCAIRNLNGIVAEADAIMVARGDLGVECPYEDLPLIQRHIVRTTQLAMKPVIIATHLLESMIHTPMPTRAEITDVSNAVLENTDAIMLSGETSVGRYPLACIEVLQRVAARVENSRSQMRFQDELKLTLKSQWIASAAVHLADRLHARCLCVFTQTGRLAGLCAALRPERTRVFAFTPNATAANQLCLRQGVTSFVMPAQWDAESTIRAAERMLLERGLIAPGDRIVAVSNMLAHGEIIGAVQLREIARDAQGQVDSRAIMTTPAPAE